MPDDYLSLHTRRKVSHMNDTDMTLDELYRDDILTDEALDALDGYQFDGLSDMEELDLSVFKREHM